VLLNLVIVNGKIMNGLNVFLLLVTESKQEISLVLAPLSKTPPLFLQILLVLVVPYLLLIFQHNPVLSVPVVVITQVIPSGPLVQ
jgi:hypothetical protein